ncbi:DUF6760 family protein [Sorangium sp. So ce1000]|uniref:DUF6760 family protein n=1 Tax=Sorangium sp. So ce1000 TaxID=3133325 RepID=UPI003F62366E
MSELRRDVQVEFGHDKFFVPGVDQEELRKEIFFLAYHLHWSWNELMDLDVAERRAYVRLLVEQIERENAQIEASRKR